MSDKRKEESAEEWPPRPAAGRNRMFANAFGAIRGTGAAPLPGSSRTPRTRREQEKPVEKLDDLDDIISQISDMNMRHDRSAAQIKRNIASCSYVKQMDEEEWNTLCRTLLETAVDRSEGEFVVGLFASFMEYPGFADAISQQLMELTSKVIMEDSSEKFDSVIMFLGSVIIGNWPRHMNKAIDNENIVLYLAHSTVLGWCQVLKEDNQAVTSKDEPALPPDSDESEEEVEEEEFPQENPVVVNRCAKALATLCSHTQRSLWMKWPEGVDAIYAVIKITITHNNKITGDVKAALLQTLIDFHEWTRTKAVTKKSLSTQTV